MGGFLHERAALVAEEVHRLLVRARLNTHDWDGAYQPIPARGF
jgi:hypothetical protein